VKGISEVHALLEPFESLGNGGGVLHFEAWNAE
jgi:hypothetical protein